MYDYFRGPDSTGLAAINRAGTDAKIAKIASHPFDLFDSNRFTKILSAFNSSAFIGHNRAATKGVINEVNAHPYRFDHIVGAHNGTLDSSSFKALKDALEEEFDVDSQAIFAHIAKFGIEATVPLLQGAWALVWYDLKDRTINFLRNKERSFFVAYTEDFSKMFWASEWRMINLAVESSAQGYKMYTTEQNHSYFATPIDVHWCFSLDEFGKFDKTKPVPVSVERKGKEPAPVKSYGSGYSPFDGKPANSNHSTQNSGGKPLGDKTGTTPTHQQKSLTTTYRGTSHTLDASVFTGNRLNPFAGFLLQERFEKMAVNGCAWCENKVHFEDIGLTVFEKSEQVLCSECSTGDPNSTRMYVTNLSRVAKAA